jgi:hypothetical protein
MKVGTIWEFGNYRGIVKIIDRKGSIVTEKVIAHIVQSVVNDVEDMDTLRIKKGYWKKVNNLARLLYE